MLPDRFLELKERDQICLRNGDCSVYTIVEKIGLVLLVVHVAFITKNQTKKWVFVNERQVEQLEDLFVGVRIAIKHPKPEYHLVTEVNTDHAIAVRTAFVHLRECAEWVKWADGDGQSAILLDAIGPDVASGKGKLFIRQS